MKPQLIKLADTFGSSFHVRFDRSPNINNFLHYHLESELVYVKRGEGRWILGEKEQRFAEGDVLLIGPGLVHRHQFDAAYLSESTGPGVELFVIHFAENFWGSEFLFLPENAVLRTLFEKSKRGVFLQDSTNRYIGYLMHRIVHVKGATRFIEPDRDLDTLLLSNYGILKRGYSKNMNVSTVPLKPEIEKILRDRNFKQEEGDLLVLLTQLN